MRFFCLCIAILLLSCNNKNSAPDVSGIKADVTIHRFDKDFFSLDTMQVQPSLHKLEQKYPAFLPLYFTFLRRCRILPASRAYRLMRRW